MSVDQTVSVGRLKDKIQLDVRHARDSAEFQAVHVLVQKHIDAFPRRFIVLSTLNRQLTTQEKRERYYYLQAYCIVNSMMIILHSPFFSFDPADISMISSYRSAKNIFAQFDVLKENYEEMRYINMVLSLWSFSMSCRTLIREVAVAREREKHGNLCGESAYNLEVQCRKFVNYFLELQKVWKTARSSLLASLFSEPLPIIDA
ncbi:hypothetical protein BT69DRAFT_260563 [Atractiella rhizophila]|nr:hypothetical protein BT69DRAFT_260563 [Atractiella rhizophila]